MKMKVCTVEQKLDMQDKILELKEIHKKKSNIEKKITSLTTQNTIFDYFENKLEYFNRTNYVSTELPINQML